MPRSIRIHLLTLPFFLMAMSCSKNGKESLILSEPIQLRESKETIDLKAVFREIELVPLKGDVLIGGLSNIIYSNNFFYVHDRIIGDIKMYDTNLNYIKSIDHTGLGPGQYRKIDKLIIKKDGIYVFSNLQSSIFKYDFDGAFLNKIRLTGFPYQVMKLGDGFLSYENFNKSSNEGNSNLNFWNQQGKLLYRAQPFDVKMTELIGYSGGVANSVSNDKVIYYNPPLSDTLFIYNGKLQVKNTYLIDGLIKNPFEGGIYSKSFNTGTRNTHGQIAPISTVFEPYIWVLYKDPPYLKTALIDLSEQTFHRLENLKSKEISALVSNVKTVDDNGYFYATPSTFFSKEWDVFKELVISQGLNIAQAQSEDFQFVVKFKISPSKRGGS